MLVFLSLKGYAEPEVYSEAIVDCNPPPCFAKPRLKLA